MAKVNPYKVFSDYLSKRFAPTPLPALTTFDKLKRVAPDQTLMEKGICPSCGSTKTRTTNDYFDYYHAEYVFNCDNCGLTAGGF